MIKVIIFDLGKVLLDFNNHLIAQRLEKLTGRQAEQIYHYIFRTGLETLFDRGEITPGEFFERIRGQFSLSIGFEEFVPLWCNIFSPVAGMRDMVTHLKERYRLGILSNTNILHFEYVRNSYSIAREITNYHLSYEMHLQKPEEAIYQRVLDYYGCRPDEMAYTDDIETYVLSARRLGIQAFLFTGAENLKEDFRRIHIDVPTA